MLSSHFNIQFVGVSLVGKAFMNGGQNARLLKRLCRDLTVQHLVLTRASGIRLLLRFTTSTHPHNGHVRNMHTVTCPLLYKL
jgi:hypothetical protein